jgi:hypothetical protein
MRPSFELGGFTFLGNTPAARRRIGDGWVVDSLRYEVATFALDSAYVAGLPIGLASETDTLLAGTPPVLVPVKSLVPEDATGIRDITEIAEFPGLAWYWYALPLLLVAAIAYWLWKRRDVEEVVAEVDVAPEPEEPPWDEAARRLRELETTDLSDPAFVKPFYVELADIFRTYLERRANVPALETTTRELVYRLRVVLRQGRVPDELVANVEEILSQADLVKFADMRPESEVGKKALAQTRSAIESAETRYLSVAQRAREAAPSGNGATRPAAEPAGNGRASAAGPGPSGAGAAPEQASVDGSSSGDADERSYAPPAGDNLYEDRRNHDEP